AAAELLPLVYDELRRLAAQKLAHEKPGHTLQPTALVHEGYLRLVGQEEPRSYRDRGHFFAAAAAAMRRILIDNARRKRTRARGVGATGRWRRGPRGRPPPSCPPGRGPPESWPRATPRGRRSWSRALSPACPASRLRGGWASRRPPPTAIGRMPAPGSRPKSA